MTKAVFPNMSDKPLKRAACTSAKIDDDNKRSRVTLKSRQVVPNKNTGGQVCEDSSNVKMKISAGVNPIPNSQSSLESQEKEKATVSGSAIFAFVMLYLSYCCWYIIHTRRQIAAACAVNHTI